MSITRSQQAKQMLRNGGMSLQEAKDMAPKGEFLAYINPKEAKMLKAAGGSGVMTKAGIPSFIEYGDGPGGFADAATTSQAAAGREFGGGGDRPNMRDVTGPSMPTTNPVFGDPDPEVDVPTRLRKDTGTSFLKNLNAERRANPFLTGASLINPIFGIPTLLRIAKQTGDMRNALGMQSPRPFDAQGYGSGQSDIQAVIDIPTWMRLGFSSEAEYLASLEKEDEKEDEGLRLAFRADGGPIGGEYDFETARQMYGFGKLVKKIGRAVKKVAKSPIGKAAIVAAGLYGLGGGTFFGKMLPGVTRGGQGFGGFGGLSSIFGNVGDIIGGKGFGDTLAKAAGSKIGLGITAASALAGLLTPKQEEEAEMLAAEKGIDIEKARRSILAKAQGSFADDFRARGFRAEGGPAEGKEPVAKKTMPLLDMGGQEMDLRAEGGFVPIGRMEKADDVPARLSKNEFVFTADAVRNAGDGNVDKGAEVMYNMMKNLEAGGEVSEESQGLEGARKMFQTSQRLEEVL